MSIIYKSSAFWPTAKNPINYNLVGSFQIVFRACLKPARVGKDFFRSSLVRMQQQIKSMGMASCDLGLHSSVKHILYRRRRVTAASILSYVKMR